LFCVIGQKAEGEEVKSKKGKGKREKEKGRGQGIGLRLAGGFGLLRGWGWQFWGFGRFMVIVRPPGFDLLFVSYYLLFGIKDTL